MYSCVCLYVMELLERAGGCKLQARGHVRLGVTIQQALNLLVVVVHQVEYMRIKYSEYEASHSRRSCEFVIILYRPLTIHVRANV